MRATKQTTITPPAARQGFRMPAEWERHEATWLGWPHHATDWPGKLNAIRWVYGEMTRKIGAGEKVRICIDTPALAKPVGRMLQRAGANLDQVEFLPFSTNRGWMRDSGPIFLRRDPPRSALAILHCHFNAWARYDDWQRDRRLPDLAARWYDLPLVHARVGDRDFIAEGGALEVNGRGTLLTTEECLLDQETQVRNPGLSRAATEQVLRDNLGVRHILWLGHGLVGDDTHGHIDDLCRFVNPRTVVLCQEKNPHDVNYRPLAENAERLQGMRLEDGSKIEVVPLPMPEPLYFDGYRLPASYANFYISNAAVIVPTFNDPQDRVALGILADCFTDRPVVGIHAVDLVLGFGTLHCLTQQQPACP